MATYCENHVEGEVERLSKLGKVEQTATKDGTCGHLGGCNTANLGLVELKCDYGIQQTPPVAEEPEAEVSTDSGTGSDAVEVEGEATTSTASTEESAEEKPQEA